MNWMFYLKTTETCNLNCKHCFTSGSKGPKVYWNTDKVVRWLQNFRKYTEIIKSEDIEKFKNEEETIDKYKKRYKERYKEELEKAVERMKKEL